MPSTTNITTSYAGKHAGKYIAAALLTSNTIEQGLIGVMPNVKYKQVLSRLDLDDVVKDATCDFTATSTVTLTERTIEVKEMQVNLQLCKADYRSSWESEEMGYSAHDNMPKTFSDFLIAHVAAKVSLKNEQNIWNGDRSNSGEYDGFERLLSVDANLPAANEVTGTTVTAANVQAELGKVVDAIPSSIYGREDLCILVARNVYKAYVRSLNGYGVSGLGANGIDGKGALWYSNGQNLTFDGIPVKMCNGMSDNVMICTYKENLFFGCGLQNDLNQVKVIDTSETLGDENVRIVMRFTGAVQYAISEDIVTYGIVNAAN